jgi:hypothetical protein
VGKGINETRGDLPEPIPTRTTPSQKQMLILVSARETVRHKVKRQCAARLNNFEAVCFSASMCVVSKPHGLFTRKINMSAIPDFMSAPPISYFPVAEPLPASSSIGSAPSGDMVNPVVGATAQQSIASLYGEPANQGAADPVSFSSGGLPYSAIFQGEPGAEGTSTGSGPIIATLPQADGFSGGDQIAQNVVPTTNDPQPASPGEVPPVAPSAQDYQAQGVQLTKDAFILSSAAQRSYQQGDPATGEAYQQAANAAYYAAQEALGKATTIIAGNQRDSAPAAQSSPFAPGFNTGESSAGLDHPTITPNYVAINGSGLGMSGGAAVNADNGNLYLGAGGAVPLPPSANAVAGYIIGNSDSQTPNRAANTDNFLNGSGIPAGFSLFGLYFGVNHAIGGATALEIGVGTPGVSAAPNPGASAGVGVSFPVTLSGGAPLGAATPQPLPQGPAIDSLTLPQPVEALPSGD